MLRGKPPESCRPPGTPAHPGATGFSPSRFSGTFGLDHFSRLVSAHCHGLQQGLPQALPSLLGVLPCNNGESGRVLSHHW
ncbi:hypothetical protein GDO78_014808 [Eleutherodactylus coqui]|uniref:Uncharacterized protein n=1 Tax=Eleutherodactylus coqui TaxID=57060 RepID=A0A8J6BC11_ELECQ|nr:hypothetical protein GDO78_014808 [Eleutherodactylus coqui]